MSTGLLRQIVPLCSCALAMVMAAACGGGSDGDAAPASGPARPFMMGFSTVPRELNAEAYAETFKLAGEYGDMVLIQRTPPWGDFLPGGTISDETAKTTKSEKDALDDEDLRLFFAIDPTDSASGRDRLASLPESLAGKNFGDAAVREAFISYAKYVALNYKPDYLALGVEVNLYYGKNKDDFENFRSLYGEAYDSVKQISPSTQVTVTYQYEDLQGILPTADSHFADWQLLKSFDPKIDVITISTHPSLAFSRASAIPANYYSQLTAFTNKPIAIAQMSYSSAVSGMGLNNGTEEDQETFLRRVLDQAEELRMPFVIWFAGWDPTFATDGTQSVFEHIGLLRADNSEKPAWHYWAEVAARPLAR